MSSDHKAIVTIAGSAKTELAGGTADRTTGVFELRQYTLHPGQRDELIDLFESKFMEAQEAVGAYVLGTFRDLDDPDRFVWLRGFTDMASRRQALAAFYGGPVWNAHRDAANTTMLDSDNVLLLRPAQERSSTFERFTSETNDAGVYGMSLHYLYGVDADTFACFFHQTLAASRELQELSVLGFTTEATPNNFPQLPVRENELVYGWISRWSNPQAMEATWAAIDRVSGWREEPIPLSSRR